MTTTAANAKAAIRETIKAAAAKSAEVSKEFGGPNAGARHRVAWYLPNGFEAAIVNLADALADYADQHAARYESPLGDDGVLGPAWLDALKGWRTLLNGDLGRLDGGTCDATFYAIGTAAGFSDEDLQS